MPRWLLRDEAEGFVEVLDECGTPALVDEERSGQWRARRLVARIGQRMMREVMVHDRATCHECEVASVIESALRARGAHHVAGDAHSSRASREMREEISEQLTGERARFDSNIEIADDEVEVVDQVTFQECRDDVTQFR